MHSWLGLYAGIVLAILSATGVAALFKVEIDRALNAGLFTVPVAGVAGPVASVIARVRHEHGAKYHFNTYPPKSPGDTWRVAFFIRKGLDFKQTEVFIDPYTASVVGERDHAASFGAFLRNIHVRLYENVIGRKLVGLAGLALLLSTLTGLWIYGGFMKGQLFAVIRRGSLRMTMADLHKLVGVGTVVFNMMIAATGTWLGLQGWLQPALMGDRPGTFKRSDKPIPAAQDVDYEVDYDRVVARSHELFPEMVVHSLRLSHDGSRTVRVAGDVPGTAYERHSFSLTLDKETLAELHRYDIRDAPAAQRLFYVQESLHFGDYGGTGLKLLYVLFGLSSAALSLAGFVIYLERTSRKRKQSSRPVSSGRLAGRWTVRIAAVLCLLAVLHLSFGVVPPAVLVVVVFHGTWVTLGVRALLRLWRNRHTAGEAR